MISVCIATYNGGEMLRQQLDSIVGQLSEEDELILSEDGDMDALRRMVADYSFPNIRIVEGARFHSPTLNFENCLQYAKGDVIFLADQDDKWVDGKVEKMMAALMDADCVCSDCYVTDSEFRVTAPSFYELINIRRGKFFNLLRRNCYLGCCMAFKRSVLRKALPFPAAIPMHDIWLGNVAAFYFRMKFIDDKLIYFRRHGSNLSSTTGKSPYSLWRKLKFRWQVIKGLFLVMKR